jgi:CIC family chloride channel protein
VNDVNPLKIVSSLHKWFKSQHFGRSATSDRYAFMEACLIGFFSALAALLLKNGIGWLGGIRLKFSDAWGATIALPLFGLILGAIAGFLVEELSPSAGGGGIPQVKGALAGFSIPLSFQVAITKIIGTILVLGAGLTLGRRGPTVHIGAALAAGLTRFVPTSPEHRRQMIAAGAAAGLAAGFNTPIAGVLFVIEELMRDISGLTLQTAIVASFTGAVVSLVLQSPDLQLPQTLLSLENITFTAAEIPFYLILGAIAGVLGAIFNLSILASVRFNSSLRIPLYLRIGIVGLISGVVISLLPPFFRDNSGLREILITGELNWQATALAFIAHFCLTILAAGSGAPGGLFAPALVMGSALGYLMGDVEEFITGTASQSTYALVGMGAFFTGVVRVPVTAIVIVFELNANFNLVLPLMITCVVAYLSAETFDRGSLYQNALKEIGMELNEKTNQQRNNFLSDLKAAEVMQSQVETISADLPIPDLLKFMSKSHHRGFPVVSNQSLVGIITQSDLEKITAEREKLLVRDIMTKRPITVQPTETLGDVLYLLNRYQLSRLPVVEGNKLVGIITRTDIIRVEVDKLTADTQFKPQPTYTCYQTHSPEIGKGRILVPIAPEDDDYALFTIASAIARAYKYEIEFIQVRKISKHSEPRTSFVNYDRGRIMMQRLEKMGKKANLPVHTQIIIAHHRLSTILEVIQKRHINLLLMGWSHHSHSHESVFSHLIENLINKASCELILVKLGKNQQYYPYQLDSQGTCLVATSGGPNAEKGLKLLPVLLSEYKDKLPSIWLAKVFSPTETELDCRDLDLAAENLFRKINTAINPLCIRSHSVVNALSHLAEAEKCDLVILGASRESLLQQAFHGNIPLAIALKLDTTVIIVRLPASV